MKTKINIKSIVWALIAITSFSLTSCEEDEFIARTLDGTWKGNMYVSYQVNGMGHYYDASYSEISFLRDPHSYASGDGYWVDYYDDYTHYGWERNYIASHIKWEVFNGNIRIHFVEDNTNVTIYNYTLDDRHFTGYIDLHNGGRQQFCLSHTSSPNWSIYHWGNDVYYHHSYANMSIMDLEDENTVVSSTSEASDNTMQATRVFKVRE